MIKNYLKILALTLAALWIVKTLNISYPMTVAISNTSSELSVVGEGKVEVIPDAATVQVGITVNNLTTAKDVQNEIAKINNNIIDEMKKLGVEKKDIKTSGYSIYPNYSYEGASRIIGYNGNTTLDIKVKDIALASQVVDVATQAGANEIHGTTFTVDKPEKYREQARNKAIENAKEQAKKLSKSLGIKLGKVTNIIESSPGTGDPIMPRTAAEGYGGGESPNFAAGTQTITSVVTLYFEKR